MTEALRWKSFEPESPVFCAVKRRDAGALERLLAGGADADGLGSAPFARLGRSTGLNLAAYLGDAGSARLLLAHGADVNWGGGGRTSLHWAAMHGNAELVGILLGEGADAYALSEATEFDGRNNPCHEGTPLYTAAAVGSAPGVEALLARGVDPDRGGNPRTPLQAALALTPGMRPAVGRICRALLGAGARLDAATAAQAEARHPGLLEEARGPGAPE